MAYIQKEKIDLLTKALTILKGDAKSFLKAKRVTELSENFKNLLDQHAQLYYWYKNNYGYIVKLDTRYFFKALQKIVQTRSEKEIKDEIKSIQDEFTQEKKKRDALVTHFPSSLKNILYFFQQMTRIRDERKGLQMMLATHMKMLHHAIAKKCDFAAPLLDNMLFEEIDAFVEDPKKFVKILHDREELLIFKSEKSGQGIETQKKAREIHTIIEEGLLKDSQELTGLGVSKGKVKGSVKIITKVSEFSKFKKGDILVAAMTRPDFVPIMEKAKAIVTDEGGITSHAAIVSRELGVPCIVGTQVATKVLKDNDNVEVDADEGIVRKL